MPEPELPEPESRPCVDAVKKIYAVSDAIYDATNSELIGEERASVLSLLSEARNLALDCGCDDLADGADDLRIHVTKKPKVEEIQAKLETLKKRARACLKQSD